MTMPRRDAPVPVEAFAHPQTHDMEDEINLGDYVRALWTYRI